MFQEDQQKIISDNAGLRSVSVCVTETDKGVDFCERVGRQGRWCMWELD